MKNLLFAFAALLLLTACDKDTHYQKFEKAEGLKWPAGSPMTFVVAVQEGGQPAMGVPYELGVELRHTSYSDWVEVPYTLTITFPSGRELKGEYVLPIRNPESGELLGEAMGDICDTPGVAEHAFQFPEAGEYKIAIQHQDEQDLLGVVEVGLRVRLKQ